MIEGETLISQKHHINLSNKLSLFNLTWSHLLSYYLPITQYLCIRNNKNQ